MFKNQIIPATQLHSPCTSMTVKHEFYDIQAANTDVTMLNQNIHGKGRIQIVLLFLITDRTLFQILFSKKWWRGKNFGELVNVRISWEKNFE